MNERGRVTAAGTKYTPFLTAQYDWDVVDCRSGGVATPLTNAHTGPAVAAAVETLAQVFAAHADVLHEPEAQTDPISAMRYGPHGVPAPFPATAVLLIRRTSD